MKLKKGNLILLFFAVLPFVVSAVAYPYLPDQIADHWNSAGVADGYSSKAFALFFMPVFLLAITLFVMLMFRLDPQKDNIDRSAKFKAAILWFMVLLTNAVNTLTIAYAFHKQLNTTAIISSLLGVGIVAIGNYLPKCKYNYTLGIRFPWTLASEDNWNKTHRIAGPVWVIGGILIMVSGIFNWVVLLYAALVLMIVVPALYSYLAFRHGQS